MDLVHDVNALAHRRGGVHRLVPQGAHLIHAVVGGGVQFQHVQNGAVLNAKAGGAGVAWVPVHRVLAVDRPGQDLGAGGLTGPPCPREQIGMGKTAGRHLALQRFCNVLLPDHLVKRAGAPLAVKCLIQKSRRPFLKK